MEQETRSPGTWYDDYGDSEDDTQIAEYDLTATPNDFNVLTIFQFIESGAVKIPGFQRNFVWDLARSSKLIESLILGLPVPQIFLYEESRNSFLVIDGQQRLMSIYYFMKKRFPRKEKRAELRQLFERENKIPDTVLHDDTYFSTFQLKLSERLPERPNKFKGLNYATLADYRAQFDLRPIRNVIVKQNSPKGDDSSVYEIFNRLNSGGINLTPQEIRGSLYHSRFYDMLHRINSLPAWRRLLGAPEPDLHMKDIEILLRAFAMLVESDVYSPSLTRFLNRFSRSAKEYDEPRNTALENAFGVFLEASTGLPADSFLRPNGRFNIALFESVFVAAIQPGFREARTATVPLREDAVRAVVTDPAFVEASQQGTTRKVNVQTRLERARALIT